MSRIRCAPVMILLVSGALLAGCARSETGTAITGSAPSSAATGGSSGAPPLPDVSAPPSSRDAGTRSAGTRSAGTPPAGTPIPVSIPVTTPSEAPVGTPATTRTSHNPITAPQTTAPQTTAPMITAPQTTAPMITAPTTTAPHTPVDTAGLPTGAGFPVCPSIGATDIPSIVGCLKASVSTFWSGALNHVVDQDVIVDPKASQVPADCRGGLTAAPAFTCRINDTVYINQSFLDAVTSEFGSSDIPYALASVVSHEIGHVVQAAVKQPGYDRTGTSNAISQQIEQQADCLSGVWARSQVELGRLSSKVFQTVAKQLITDVSSNAEISTHGTPDQRAAAIGQGLSTGTPQGCRLNTFS